jgi:hypothetical protein
MDSDALAKEYMAKYDELIKKYENSNIQETIEKINTAIRQMDVKTIQNSYNTILDWNYEVANLEGIRTSLNGQFKHLHLPSVIMFTIAYDENEKRWQFNTSKY